MAKYRDILDEAPPPPRKHRVLRFIGRHLPSVSLTVIVTSLLIVVLWPLIVITVPSGRVGVLWYRLIGFDLNCWCFIGRGTALDPRDLKEEGLHIIAPWNRLFIYDLRLQSTTLTINAISKDGVSVAAQINVRYQLLHHSVGVVHKFIGPDYLDSVVAPEIGSQARQVISQYSAQEVYTSRETIQEQIRDSTQKSLGANLNKLVQPEAMELPDPKHYNDFLQNAIQILDTLVLSIELPPAIVAAINRQTEQFYLIQEYKFRVESEAEESKRKQIEANGIAAFQRTVSQGISDSYLRWRGIEATLALAQSRNAKIVVIGTGKDGLPIILGNVDTPATSSDATKPESPAQPGTSGKPPPPGAPPNPTDRAPDRSSPAPAAKPPGEGSSQAQPPASDDKTSSAAPAGPSRAPSFVESVLSRASEALDAVRSAPPSVSEEQPRQ